MAGKPDEWMPLYIAHYLRKTMHLTRDQHGGYMLLLMACWDRGGRLPNDPGQLAGIARATPAEWKKLAPVLMPFFEVDGDFLVQSRVLEEREKAERLSDARRQAGRQGGRPPKQPKAKPESKTETEGKAIGLQTGSQNETPTRVALQSTIDPPSEYSVSDETGAEAPSDRPDPIADIRSLPVAKGSWRLALKVLMDRGGYPESRARPLVGKWAKELDNTDDLWRVAEAAWDAGTLDPVSYITAAVERIAAERSATFSAPSLIRQRAWMEDFRSAPGQWREHERGPKPGRPGCRVDPGLQREFGVEPAEEAAA